MAKGEITVRFSDIDRRLLKRIADAMDRKSPKVNPKRLREPFEGYVSGTTLIQGDEIGFRDEIPTETNPNAVRHIIERAERDEI